ncbi:Glutathione transport system permease protein GsiD [bioreactor metagenome]|jgi:peptide/nickel transport system permease protein|uniref:Glutathione transport system permease protein GsiD n=1 Tax=bioreactor metagenome TaxID=1076179 RepID=A0A644ZFU9_9ZZZZ|nr:ABC transporter permease [Aminivibrio sp.]MEA4952614.1 ABC transporter permease [Aminivibrio sp.]
MNQVSVDAAAPVIVFRKESRWKEVWRRLKKDRLAMFGLAVISTMIILALLADFIVSYEAALKMNLRLKLAPPSAVHWFGCDGYGRDLFARCLHGARVSLTVGFATSIATLIVGSLLGAMVGYIGGKLDDIVMRALDIFSAIPSTLFAMAVVAAMGSGIVNICIAISITNIPGFVRIVRSSVLNIAEQEYIEASRAGGTSTLRILLKHVLPNSVGTLIVQTTANVASMILTAATLSFLGLGINPPQPEWGALVSEGKEFLRTAPHLILFPGVMICVASFSMSVLGDGLRDALDPRLRT